jgi:D-alanyl-D-alanine dipeptidase
MPPTPRPRSTPGPGRARRALGTGLLGGALGVLTASAPASARPHAAGTATREAESQDASALVDLDGLHPLFLFDVRYATADNFFGKKVYAEARCLLRRPIAERMVAAQDWLTRHHPGLRLLFKDCYRPHSVQFVLWEAVKGTPRSAYVANPHSRTGSIHSYGAAVDLTLADADGHELDMGTPYDHLGPLAEPRRESEFLARGELTRAHLSRRLILRRAMREGARMKGIPNEWWHFEAGTKAEVRARYARLDVPFEAVPRGPGSRAAPTAPASDGLEP